MACLQRKCSTNCIVNVFQRYRKKAIVKYLISAGADVKIMTKNGFTAFDMATMIGKALYPIGG